MSDVATLVAESNTEILDAQARRGEIAGLVRDMAAELLTCRYATMMAWGGRRSWRSDLRRRDVPERDWWRAVDLYEWADAIEATAVDCEQS